ncbi:hypothetical protein SARC_09645 [Sphaeroforma arctica JP610]|uniref:Uncharacterized protein n=1 Tax=Sphaeroforma arctica JP610 TaxID=667725 RepID=A0A0L0FMC8_9EUKA|nr:hypothetical protein SARC_09645 [Sphaeroforma arctica JP610]KNC77910.1 hypothetical protein SARC_09645 [Sphaeroforma arctica JP610]|eukprot:XP_014151812.1 hypothetical protein SARC_09645 [Sphaeroforma arctica JP610]
MKHPDFPHKRLNFEGYKELDSIEAIQKLMHTFAEDVQIQESGCEAIKLYCRIESNRARACRALFHDDLQMLMQKFPNEKELQHKRCLATCNICLDPTNRMHAGSIKAHNELQAIMDSFREDVEIQLSVCGAMECYMLEEENRAMMAVGAANTREGTIHRSIQQTMQAHTSNAEVQASAMRALGTLCMQGSDAESKHVFEDICALVDVQHALRTFDKVTVQQEGLWMLQNACANASQQQLQMLGESGLFIEIQRAMCTYTDDLVVQYGACMVLACALTNAANRTAAGKRGLHSDVINALMMFAMREISLRLGYWP